jgi:NADH:ubiquinone oxidoreductase subunit 6 (subunit J)
VNLFDILYIIAALLIFITAVARLNDIKKEQNSKRWWVRRVGLLFVSVSMVMVVASYFTTATPYWNHIMKITGLWGFALTWLTTPGMPPWWRYISRYDESQE